MTTVFPGTFAQALASVSINANDTLYLRAGTYTGDFVSTLIGSGAYPITVRAYPGERAIIDGYFYARGHSVIFRDLEFTFSGWTTRVSAFTGSTPADIPYTKCLAAEGFSLQFINCVIHNQSSPAFQSLSANASFYGCVIFHHGWDAPDRGHGHGLYVQNSATFRKTVENCIIFDNYGWGIHAYTEGGQIDRISLIGNTCFGAGSPGGHVYDDILVGGYVVAQNPILERNLTYGGPVNLGYSAGVALAELRDNYFAGGITKVNANISVETGNYYGASGVGDAVFFRANRYAPGRAHVTVFNEAEEDLLTQNVREIAAPGETVRVTNVQDYFGDSYEDVVTSDGEIGLDMDAGNRSVATPVQGTAPASVFPTFGCFVLEKV